MRKSAVRASSLGVTWLGRETQGRAGRWKENKRKGEFLHRLDQPRRPTCGSVGPSLTLVSH